MTIPLFQNKRILLGVTGSIACYKAADLASSLRQAGALVDVVLTAAATEFVTPLTFQSVTGRPAFLEADLWGRQGHVIHVGLTTAADLMIIAPATANTIAKLALGTTDNLLTLTALAAQCPLLIAPAMDGGMYEHPATQANIKTLQERGVQFLGPTSGHLASGLSGWGRMLEPAAIHNHLRLALAADGLLSNHRTVVTAGGTQEPLDPVRFLTNLSSGKQGFALAQAALDLGAEVVLITGPTLLETPTGAKRVDVQTAQEMHDAVLEALPQTDALIMAAAVSDFTPAEISPEKLKKRAGIPRITLKVTPDILSGVSWQKSKTGFPRLMVGFAAESQDLLENAREKLAAKKLDFIVANDIRATDSGFAVDTNRVTLLFADGRTAEFPLMSKAEVAAEVLGHVASALGAKA
jgi:phosphopantothenoylcysteine decarboxylase/phosphopantothenate--cysteine ligase